MTDSNQQHLIIDTLTRNLQQVRRQLRHTHVQLGVLMMAKKPESLSHILKHVSPETEARDADSNVTKEGRNNVGRRKSFAIDQLLSLEFHYSQSRYLKGKRLGIVAEQLKLTKNQVKIWFQNRRAKENRYRRLMMKRRDEEGPQRLQTKLPTTPPPKLPPNVTQQQPMATHSHPNCQPHAPGTSSLLLRDARQPGEASFQNIDLAGRAPSL